MVDPASVPDEVGGLVEDGVGVGGVRRHEVDGRHVHAGGESPHVEVVGVVCSFDPGETPAELVEVEVVGGSLDEDPQRLSPESPCPGEDEGR